MPVSTTVAGSSQRTRSPPRVHSRAAAPRGLPTRAFARAYADRSTAPDGATPCPACPGRPSSLSTVSGPGPQDRHAHRSTALKITSNAGDQQRRLRAVQVPHALRGAADQLPAARAVAGIDAGEAARQPDRAGRDPGARRVPPGHVEPGVTAGQIAEAGDEAGEGHRPSRAGVQGDHLVLAQPGALGHLGQVRPVVSHRDLHRRGAGAARTRRRAARRWPSAPLAGEVTAGSSRISTVRAAGTRSTTPGRAAVRRAA